MGNDAGGMLLAVSPFAADFSALQQIFRDSPWRLERCLTRGEACERLERRPVPVVMCEQELPDGSWREVLEHTKDQPSPSSLIVTSRLADERLWSEVLHLGGYDVLSKPFRQSEVFRVATLAYFYWKNRRMMRAAGRH
ncbi:MAG TPA: hypothetical protein VG672_09280 [Bryobacteraceae bacterium]|jgi:response regulator RpfG family c-di-GMP phosphodiesterase|nr:hypothetical protein [Bryobacteraceae bacterium]